MVKADLTRDYYGDLELTPAADVAEIKKQFKKLGKSPFCQFCIVLLFFPARLLHITSLNLFSLQLVECRSAGCLKVFPTGAPKYEFV